MIPGFEEYTQPLSDEEKKMVPVLVNILSKCKGENNALKSKDIIRQIKGLTDARLRKLINHIRINDLVSCLIATSKGYYIENDEKKVSRYVDSLTSRAEAILYVAKKLKKQLNDKNTKTLTVLNKFLVVVDTGEVISSDYKEGDTIDVDFLYRIVKPEHLEVSVETIFDRNRKFYKKS